MPKEIDLFDKNLWKTYAKPIKYDIYHFSNVWFWSSLGKLIMTWSLLGLHHIQVNLYKGIELVSDKMSSWSGHGQVMHKLYKLNLPFFNHFRICSKPHLMPSTQFFFFRAWLDFFEQFIFIKPLYLFPASLDSSWLFS